MSVKRKHGVVTVVCDIHNCYGESPAVDWPANITDHGARHFVQKNHGFHRAQRKDICPECSEEMGLRSPNKVSIDQDEFDRLQKIKNLYSELIEEVHSKHPGLSRHETARQYIQCAENNSDMVLLPRKLTAENGSKYALMGEFKEPSELDCHECYGEGCEECAHRGWHRIWVPVSWTTIKDIYKKIVEVHDSHGTGSDS